MGKAKVGDKFIIEVDSVYKDTNNNELYKIKGFNSLVFDSNGIDKLVDYNELAIPVKREMVNNAHQNGYAEGYKAGAEAQLKACEKVINDITTIGSDKEFLRNMYGVDNLWEVLKSHEISEIIAHYKNYKSVVSKTSSHILRVGDIVKAPGCDDAIVTMISGNRCHVVGKNFKGDVDIQLVSYTGKHHMLFEEL